jgi:hypothetical protein
VTLLQQLVNLRLHLVHDHERLRPGDASQEHPVAGVEPAVD